MCRQEVAVEDLQQQKSSDAEKGSVLKSRSRPSFEVRQAIANDAKALSSLYQQDYVDCHRGLHSDIPAGDAAVAEWEAALGAVDFDDVLAAPPQPLRQKIQPKAGRKQIPENSVRLLKCTARNSKSGTPVGYVLYEIREKGPRTARQRYCELVNIVVQESSRGCGAGRALFDALREDLVQTAPEHAGDLRLFVAERNLGPLEWYRRIGFRESGWQTETIGGSTVRFVRMAFKAPAA
eukprot:TRINITY_DN42231_c0_g1_i1.p1 TRINITY_DN42231_c0_g1~~TRINITY_DN42231_c0_g1_i1.p1  ORF type:complete len:266 (+),score=59.07 TRINITY_DN42231_c0_g1_i1:93-800(+)